MNGWSIILGGSFFALGNGSILGRENRKVLSGCQDSIHMYGALGLLGNPRDLPLPIPLVHSQPCKVLSPQGGSRHLPTISKPPPSSLTSSPMAEPTDRDPVGPGPLMSTDTESRRMRLNKIQKASLTPPRSLRLFSLCRFSTSLSSLV